MAKATAVHGVPTPLPTTGVTLELSLEEAHELHALVRSIGGVGGVRNTTDAIDTALYEALGYKTNLRTGDGDFSNGFFVDGLEAVRAPDHWNF